MISFDSYQSKTGATAVYPGQGYPLGLLYAAIGAGNEAGEILGKVKKAIRDDGLASDVDILTDDRRAQILDEVGDVLWYLARVCEELDASLEGVAENNLRKLNDRLERGVIAGSGDNR